MRKRFDLQECWADDDAVSADYKINLAPDDDVLRLRSEAVAGEQPIRNVQQERRTRQGLPVREAPYRENGSRVVKSTLSFDNCVKVGGFHGIAGRVKFDHSLRNNITEYCYCGKTAPLCAFWTTERSVCWAIIH